MRVFARVCWRGASESRVVDIGDFRGIARFPCDSTSFLLAFEAFPSVDTSGRKTNNQCMAEKSFMANLSRTRIIIDRYVGVIKRQSLHCTGSWLRCYTGNTMYVRMRYAYLIIAIEAELRSFVVIICR